MSAAARFSATVLLLGAALGVALAALRAAVITVGTPHDALAATPSTTAGLFWHNLPVVAWPLALFWLGWTAIPVARAVGDALISGQLLWHGVLLGNALAQEPGLWRYLPHLPLELTALAIPAAAWFHARRTGTPATKTLATLTATVVALLMAAAILESYLVPL